MQRAAILFSVLAVAVLCAFAINGQAQDDKMTINNPKAFAAGKQRGPVVFGHAQHVGMALACTKCHHKYDPAQPGKNLWSEGDETNCAACHAGAKPVSKMGLQESFHKLCWGCHEKPSRQMKYGPRSCAGCHAVK